MNLQPLLTKVNSALQNNKTAGEGLEETLAKEITWIQQQFKEIHELFDKYEENLLNNLETIKSAGKKLLETQRAELNQLQSQLASYNKFISGVLQPCRSSELVAYCKWIKKQAEKFTKPPDVNPAYDINSLSIMRGDIKVFDFADKLDSLTMHQAFHQPHLPNCTVRLTSKCIVPVVVEVTMKDKHGLPVPNQLPHLEIQSKELTKDFFIDSQTKYIGNGVYHFSYCPKVKQPHELDVTWKGDSLSDKCVQVAGAFNYPAITSHFHDHYVGYYNKRNMRKPQFLFETSDGCAIIISDPADSRLIFFEGKYYFYQYVITNNNNPCQPSGFAIGCNDYLYVADTYYNSILKYRRGFHQYENRFFSSFGTTGSENGQFNCPQGLVISKSKLIFICDKGNHRIQVFSIARDGKEKFSFSFGSFGEQPGCFNHPTDLTLNKTEDKLFVADTDNHRVQVFTSSGRFLTTFPRQTHDFKIFNLFGSNSHTMLSPVGICFTMDGRILVSSKDHVFVFEEDGTQVTTIDFHGKDPAGIIMRNDGTIVVAQCGKIVYCQMQQ